MSSRLTWTPGGSIKESKSYFNIDPELGITTVLIGFDLFTGSMWFAHDSMRFVRS
jgi:hypothetical protein